MKKTLIAILLVACVCVPTVAARSYTELYPAVGITSGVTFDNGKVAFKGIGAYGELSVILSSIPVAPAVRVEFMYSFEDASQTSVNCALLANVMMFGRVGAEAQLHLINDKVVADYAAVLCGGMPVAEVGDFMFCPLIMAKYVFVNNTNAPDFTLGLDVNAIIILGMK